MVSDEVKKSKALEESKKLISNLQETIKSLELVRDLTAEQLEESQKIITNSEKTIKDLREGRDLLTKQLKDSKRTISERDRAISALERERNTHRKEIADLSKQRDSFKAWKDQHSADEQGAERTAATLSFTVPHISGLAGTVWSPPRVLRGLPWQLGVQHSGIYLWLYLRCNDFALPSSRRAAGWTCSAKIQTWLLSHELGVEPRCWSGEQVFSQANNSWSPMFMYWIDVVDPASGYTKDGSITVEAHVTTEAPRGFD